MVQCIPRDLRLIVHSSSFSWLADNRNKLSLQLWHDRENLPKIISCDDLDSVNIKNYKPQTQKLLAYDNGTCFSDHVTNCIALWLNVQMGNIDEKQLVCF